MYRWLPEEDWQAYLKTYCSADADSMWKSVEIMCRLFYDTSEWVSGKCGFSFNREEADNSLFFMNRVKNLPPDADSIM